MEKEEEGGMDGEKSLTLRFSGGLSLSLCDVSSVKPDRRDNHHSSAISTKSLARSECEEMLCCQLEGSGFSPDEWRKGSVTPVNDPQRPLVSCPGTTQWPPLRVIEEPKWPLL
ncbi:hypothetical protein FQN60_015285 [Etheostoma spectabile]|uniref:Uncharacterized protein n=1 Tax=Etheostoma spectabile TaxID=54343 RepID=A0A5J5CQR0_9PERO|nr:hypothetical protein FQN60_015285 [Etheostoma spectabile]